MAYFFVLSPETQIVKNYNYDNLKGEDFIVAAYYCVTIYIFLFFMYYCLDGLVMFTSHYLLPAKSFLKLCFTKV